MTNEQWNNLQKFEAHRKVEERNITGTQAFFISFLSTFYMLALVKLLIEYNN